MNTVIGNKSNKFAQFLLSDTTHKSDNVSQPIVFNILPSVNHHIITTMLKNCPKSQDKNARMIIYQTNTANIQN